jgi:hypothetical protein
MAQIVIDSNSNLIQGDFDSATVNNRTKFQTSTPNANTGVYAVPNGSGTVAGFQATNNSNPTNASKIVMATNGSTDTQIISGVNGSGTYLPLSFYTNNTLAGQFDTSGNLSVTGSVNMGSSFLRNRIINGDMRIDQRNAGASVTPINAQYTLDRWYFGLTQTSKLTTQQNAGSVTPPAGYTNYLGITSSSAYSVTSSDYFYVGQNIEGYNVADLAWGTANAKTITFSFWVRSSLTGTFGGAIDNSAFNRGYPFSYTISSANTWEQKTITIAGDTTGTWLTTNGNGMFVIFGLGAGSTNVGTAGAWAASGYISATGATSVVGTSSATFYITGVQLEVGSTATPFERRLYNQELANCQRYFAKTYDTGTVPGTATTAGALGTNVSATWAYASPGTWCFPVAMRTSPTITLYSTANANTTGVITSDVTDGAGTTVNLGLSSVNPRRNNVSTGVVAGADLRVQITADAEL